jgi:hypothetical protein
MEEMNKVKVSDLKKGDIVLLECEEDDLISHAIALLTRSKVTHATISRGIMEGLDYNGVGYIAEETPRYATYSTLLDRTERVAYVMRLQPEEKDMQPVMDLVDYYIAKKWPYASLAQPFLAMYFLVKDISDTLHLCKIGTKLMKLAMGTMIELFNQLLHDGKNPMMCSQFAYHCYKEAGSQYQIHMKDEKKPSLFTKTIEYLRDHYQDFAEDFQADSLQYASELMKENTLDTKIVLEELCQELQKSKDVKSDNQLKKETSELPHDFVAQLIHFCKLFYKVFVPKDEQIIVETESNWLEQFALMQEYFIAPEDLFHNTKNLICLGTLDYEGYHI